MQLDGLREAIRRPVTRQAEEGLHHQEVAPPLHLPAILRVISEGLHHHLILAAAVPVEGLRFLEALLVKAAQSDCAAQDALATTARLV